MRHQITIEGLSALIVHSTAGMDARHEWAIEIKEISRKRGDNRTETDDKRIAWLETALSLWLDDNKCPTINPAALRANLEAAARKLKQGPQVREGLVIEGWPTFTWDEARYGSTFEEVVESAQYVVPVKVQRNRVMRTRAKFDTPWRCTFVADCDDELIDEAMLKRWVDIGGSRLGIGDWRPEKSGSFGRFQLVSIEPAPEGP